MKNCINCGSPVELSYCSACGQKYLPVPYTYRTAIDWIGDLFDMDKGFFLTLWLLFVNPRKLVTEFLQGRTKKYINPFKLFFATIAIFFFLAIALDYIVVYFSGSTDKANEPEDDKEELMIYLIATLFIVAIYFMNLVLFLKKKLNPVEHLLITVYEATAFILLVIPGILLASTAIYALHLFPEDKYPISIIFCWQAIMIVFHTYFLKRVYGGNILLVVLKSFVSVVAAFFLLTVGLAASGLVD